MSIREAAASGDRRMLLETLRDELARQISEGVDAKELPALVLRLEKISKELEGYGVAGGSVKDALAERRKARKTAAG